MAQSSAPVLSIGEILIDLIAAPPSTGLHDVSRFDVRPGGAPANVAVALARLGVPAAFCGVVGTDPFGERLRATLRANGVDTRHLRADSGADTSLALAWKDDRGDGHFRFIRLADGLLSPADTGPEVIEGSSAIVVGSVALSVEPSCAAILQATSIAAEMGVPVCFDVNARPALWTDVPAARSLCESVASRATLLKLSLDDARFLFDTPTPDAALHAARMWTNAVIVLTDGARGAWFLPANSVEAVPVPPHSVEAVEPTGAGDAFTAALIAQLIDGCDLRAPTRNDIRFAAAAGALATTRPGALDGLPTRAEIEAFLQTSQAPPRAVSV